nr:MAG TPA: PaaX-like protein [Bacteriophage sp.]
MRFSTTLNNQKCMEWELNATQGVLIALLYEANAWANEEIIDDKTYYFVSRNLILKELPMFFEKSDTVYRNLKVLAEKGIIEYIKHKGMDLIRLTEKGKSWNFIESNSEKSPNFDNNSEKNPSEFGKKSENNSEKNPTYKDTNIQKDISKNKKEKNKKEKNKKEKKPNEIQEFINNLSEDNEYKELLFKYIEYRKNIKKPIKTVLPIKKIVKDFPNWFVLDEAINIAMEKEWTGLEPEWVEKHKKSKAFNNNTESKIAESKDTSHLKVDDNYIDQMKERYGL